MRKALIIGNNDYNEDKEKLKNPINDAKLMREILLYKNFEVKMHFDLNEKQMISTFDSFYKLINEGDEVIVFFAGHGVEDRDTNYLLSVDFKASFDRDRSLTIDKIQNDLYQRNKTGLKLIIVDACRNNPVYADSPYPEKITVNNNTLVAFSTSSGNVAKDGKGSNSYYTVSLVDSIKEYNLSIHEVFSRTREKVMYHTNFSQIPWEHSSILASCTFTFDSLSMPKKLARIIKSRSSISYAAKSINDTFFVGGNSNAIDYFNSSSSISGSLNLDMENEVCNIEDIDLNEKYVVFVNDDGEVVYLTLDKTDGRTLKYDLTLFSVAINELDLMYFGGMGYKIHGYNIGSGVSAEIDIKKEVLCKMYSDCAYIDYICESFTIMSIEFSQRSQSVIAFGGSDSVLCVKDVYINKYLFVNKDKGLFTYTYCIKFSSDGNYIATTHEHGKVILWDAKTFELIHIFKANEYVTKNQFFEFIEEQHSNDILHVEFLPNSKSIAIGTSESEVIFYDVKHMRFMAKIDLNIEPYSVSALAFNSKGDKLSVSLNDKNYIFC